MYTSNFIIVLVITVSSLPAHALTPFFFSVEDWLIAGCAPNCALCSANYTNCAVCAYRYGQDPEQPGLCKPCSDPACVECTADYTRCTSCTADYGTQPLGVGPDATCIPCTVAGCQSCNYDASRCDACRFNFGVNALANACEPCASSACANCTADYQKCTYCQTDGWSLDVNAATCLACTVPNCDTCDASGACTTCRLGYGLTTDGLCAPCSDPLCFQCGSNYSTCEACYSFAGLNNATGTCTRCDVAKSCLSCGGDGACTTCYDGFGLDGTGACKKCDDGFATCDAVRGDSCAPFYAKVNATDGVDCAECALKAVCTNTRMQNPYSTGAVWERDLTRCAEEWETTTTEVFPNATLCGVCGASAPTPLPISTAYFNVTTWAINGLLSQGTGALCQGGVSGPLVSVKLVKPLSWCAAGSSKPPSSFSQHDVRFQAEVVCGGGTATMALRARLNVSSTYDGNLTTSMGAVTAIPVQPSQA